MSYGDDGSSYDGNDGYVDVATRIAQFHETYPEGSLQPANPERPFEIIFLDDDRAQLFQEAYGGRKWAKYQPTAFIVYTAAAYRTPDDARPGIGTAFEPFPGLTPYTHNSEMQNAETSAWGRAIVALGDFEARASAEEVRNRRAEQDQDTAPADPPVSILDVKKELLDLFTGDDDPTAGAAAVWDMLHMPKQGTATTIPQSDAAKVLAVGFSIASGQEPFEIVAGSPASPGDPDGGDAESGVESSPPSDPPIVDGVFDNDTGTLIG